ncbi:MAG: DUF2164 family protein [Bacteroidota bacterium]
MRNRLKLRKDQKEQMVSLVKEYFLKERDEEIGDLAATIFLDFIIEKMAPVFYNHGGSRQYRLSPREAG